MHWFFAKCAVHIGRFRPRRPNMRRLMPTAKTTLNPAYGQCRICLHPTARLDDPITPCHSLVAEMATNDRNRLVADVADPPPTGEGNHPKGGGGAQEAYGALDEKAAFLLMSP